MPHSPITKLLGTLIVAGFLVVLLWPSAEAHEWGRLALAALPVASAVLTWSAVASAAPFDDRAFHRTLPVRAGHAFRRVLAIHLLVLAGIAAAVVLYGWRVNFGWRDVTWGIVILTLPLWAWMSATGVAFSLMTSRQHWKSTGCLAVFAIPVAAYTLRYWLMEPQHPSKKAWEATVITAAVGYPIIWWLISAKFQRFAGLVLATVLGAALPWIHAYGKFSSSEYQEPELTLERLPEARISIKRKPVPLERLLQQSWLPIDEAMDVEGAAKDEFLLLYGFVSERPDWRDELLLPKPDDPALREKRRPPVLPVFAREGASEQMWGEKVVWESLRSRIPLHQEFIHWHPHVKANDRALYMSVNSLAVASFRVDEALLRRAPIPAPHRPSIEEFLKSRWRAVWRPAVSPILRLVKVGELDALESGRYRLPGNGLLEIIPSRDESGLFTLELRRWSPSTVEPWTGKWRDGALPDAWIIALHQDGTAWAISGREFEMKGPRQDVFLGKGTRSVLRAAHPSRAGRDAALKDCRLFIFWPEAVAKPPSDPIPPP